MRKRKLVWLSVVMYFFSGVCFVCLLGTDFMPGWGGHPLKFITALLGFFLGYTASYLRCRYLSHARARRIIRRTLKILFVAYLMIVFDFTLIDDSFGRRISMIFLLEKQDAISYLGENSNFIPFATIRLFINGFDNGTISFSALVENLIGNFAVFMPFAFFLPILFREVRSVGSFLLSVTAVVILIELLQIVFLTGAADIDDLILNVGGAGAAYWLLHRRKISKKMSRYTFGAWNYEKK